MTKELFFFDRLWHRGARWYSAYFGAAHPDQICGETTPSYFSHPDTPRRIRETVPNVKLVFVFRHPVERAISMYHHMLSVGETRLSFRDALAQVPALIDEGFYNRHYSRFAALFGENALFPVILEETRAAGDDALVPLFNFLGVAPEFRPPSLFHRTYERRQARASRLAAVVGHATMFLRDHGLHTLVNAAKAAGAERIFYTQRPPKPEPIADEIYEQLKNVYFDDTASFGERIGHDLVSLWNLRPQTPASKK
jgi:hypothetical protein